ncbi:uncharacterized protein PAC_14642 [Phialocephala subalpina]|uniref:N-acetyltransferase domain-containing protein n=1 Tax=Phialocephala subalpina TaxID=576137 RepID=A0A1L7XI82_9HELO|nr:uncharacterized protein PAC_14642 [Phialocephala subalpina]
MATSSIVLSSAKQEDASDLAALIQENWHYKTIYPFLYPQCWEDPASVHEHILADEQKTLENTKIEAIKAEIDGKLVVAGRWTLVDPDVEGGGQGDGEPKSKPPEGSEEFRKATMQAAAKQFEEKLKGLKHFELINLNVLSGHQRHGLGTKLTQLCLARADEKGLPVFLMSVPSARDFYVRFGFEVFDVFEFDLGDWGGKFRGWGKYRFYGMLRPAQKDTSKH